MDPLIGESANWWQVALKASLMYATALLALRVGERRTLAQWTLIDFATAVAVGAVVGRTAVASGQSFLTGAVALVTFVTVHRLASLMRFNPLLGKLLDHRIRVLVADGEIRRGELRRCGLTENDLYGQLRQRGVFSLDGVRYVLYEAKGTISVVLDAAGEAHAPLVTRGLHDSAGFPDG